MSRRLEASVRAVVLAVALGAIRPPDTGALQCNACHSAEYNQWTGSPHAATQLDPAWELSHLHVGQTASSVIAGEDCIACHSPNAILANGGMNDTQALNFFFTSSNEVFTAGTSATNNGAWPHVDCTACHYVPAPHEFLASSLAVFDSRNGRYSLMDNSSQLCGQCHGDLRFPGSNQQLYNHWAASPHAHSQTNVANQLAQLWAGKTPDDVIHGSNSNNCIACHSPTSVEIRGGDEELALEYFFSTVNGQFTTNTTSLNTTEWPGVSCIACHDPHSPQQFSYFNSYDFRYEVMTNSSQLCGQCHGNLRFADSDQRLYNAWTGSQHANSQTNVASQLRQSRIGQTPQDVIHGPGGQNCIACHSPTAVLASGGDEATALGLFFTTTNGQFSATTVSTNADQWPGVACVSCHDPHNPGQLSYFNSTTKTYQVMTNSTQLCGQCHGDLRFADAQYRSYNILQGKGGIGVPEQQLMGEVGCTDCHMHSSNVAGSNSKNTAGHTWAISVTELGGQTTVSCLACHDTATPEAAYVVIDGWKAEFQDLLANVSSNLTRVAAVVQSSPNLAARAALAEAQFNLAYAKADESGGFHNHPYLMALLQTADEKASSISLLSATPQGENIIISWIGTGTLQASDSVNGPWQDVAGATNPMVIVPAQRARQQFYRLRP